ncbi:Zinc finger protein 622-like protein [Mycena indigotica]|uniref:Zinc finger protein 622-like protein n=1 Tax=Mycena indigotica TaxID=2126181 RepID=A0A8H6TDA6_9AGAR|nr:Zinc finger protein 622-like protein [Mycena indigotica]KAF7315321.1 Zinc finger protein 622-like protein [Mycena indigotica]
MIPQSSSLNFAESQYYNPLPKVTIQNPLYSSTMSATTLFTCLSCSIAFHTAEDQRGHYRSDHHRYNMKRRVASLPPVSLEVFNQKVLDRRLETAIMSSAKGSYCDVCNKTYTTENAYRSHIQSKKHKEMELKPRVVQPRAPEPDSDPVAKDQLETIEEPESVSLVVPEDASETEINQTIDEKIAAARAKLSPNSCLFCSEEAPSLDVNLEHMSSVHSFFVPDAEYLVDIKGLITYLGEKIAVGNVCIFCNGKGKEFRTLEATRKHMLDKSHCKIAYDTEDDRLEVSDYYDFTSSYPSAKNKSEGEDWEDVDDDDNDSDAESADQVVEDESELEEEELPDNGISYGDSEMQLILPSGVRINHRKLRYHPQTFLGSRRGKTEDPDSGAALVRRLLADKNSALVPRKGGFGAFGAGTDVVKARNRGEAREAGRHVREFRDQKRREDFRTKIAYINNSQKHYRDPLLQ